MKKILYICLLTAAISISPPGFTAEPQIYGQVWVGSSGAPARGATVSVACGSGGSSNDTVDSSGRYRVKGLPANTECQLTVNHGNKSSLPLKIRTTGSSLRINLELTPWKADRWLLQKR